MPTGPTAATNQFGNVQSIRGFAPLQNQGPSPMPQSGWIPVANASAVIIGKNSPVSVAAGVAICAVAGNAEPVSGVVLQMRASDGNIVSSIPASPTAGAYEVIITTSAEQRFVAKIDSNAYADTDLGDFYNISAADGMTAGTDRFLAPGEMYSERTLDGSSEATATRQFQVLGRVPMERNDAASSSGTLVYCKINPVNFVAGG